jgi:Arc/MetJ-type ribon-helix-helix transcriptional regulator
MLSCTNGSAVIHCVAVKTLTVRLPEQLVSEIEAESRGRKMSKSDVVRERLSRPSASRSHRRGPLDAIADLIGSIDKLPKDLSAQRKRYLKTMRYGRKRSR